MPQSLPVIDDRPLSADRVPTLTEVVELDLPARVPGDAHAAVPAAKDAAGSDTGTPAPPTDAPEAEAIADAPHDLATEAVVDLGPAADTAKGEDMPAPAAPVVEAVAQPIPEADAPSMDDLPPAPAEVTVDTTLDALPEDLPVSTGADGATVAVAAPVIATVDDAITLPPAFEGPVLPMPPAAPALDVDAVVGQVLAELMPRIDMLLESRLREALAPALARAADGLIRDTRLNLSVAVRDLVQEAVDRALQRRADL